VPPDFYWSGHPGIADVHASYTTVSFTDPGEYVIQAHCCSQVMWVKIYVVKINLVVNNISEAQEENPGFYINANWNDDDRDGWSPTSQAPPSATYTPDKQDPNGIDGADDDLQFFQLELTPDVDCGYVTLLFPANIRIWKTKSKVRLGSSTRYYSGTTIPASTLTIIWYIEGYAGTANFMDAELKASWTAGAGSAEDIVNITVFEARDPAGHFAYQSQPVGDNDKRHNDAYRKNSSNMNGIISWDDADADGIKWPTPGEAQDPNCWYFHNCMELEWTMKPAGITGSGPVSLDIFREKWGKEWRIVYLTPDCWDVEDDYTGTWSSDDASNNDEDLDPSGSNKIWSIDGPGHTDKGGGWQILNHRATLDFRESVYVDIGGTKSQCSDFYKWHAQVDLEQKNPSEWTRTNMANQKLGSGWITISDPGPICEY
jgi:hypothetical protein